LGLPQNYSHLHAGVHQEENTRIWTSPSKPDTEMLVLPQTQKVWSNAQAPLPPDDTPKLDAKGIKCAQQIVGSILYYARAVDMMILMALSSIAIKQTKATEKTMGRCIQFLD
jgi:hypothetical protein